MIAWIKSKLKNGAVFLLSMWLLKDLMNGYDKFTEKDN